jgi:CHAT domain-containing protein
MGRYADALPLFQRSLAIREKTFGVDHPAVAIALNNFALLCESMGRYADALPLHRRSLAISEKALGPEHPDVAASLNSLAGLSFQMGRYAEALPLYQRSLAIYEKVHGSEHPTVAIALNNLAVVYEAMRRYADALNLYQRSLAIKEKALGVEHPDVALSLHNLAVLHWHMGRRDEAFALWQRALPIVSRGDLPEYSWQVRAWLRQAFSERGQTDLAIYWGKQAVDTIQHMRSNLTSLDRELQRSFLQDKRGVYTKLADLLVGAGRLAEGQEVLGMLKEEELYDFQRRAPEADPRKTAPTFTGAEVGWQQRFAEVSGQLGSLGRELDELRRKAKFGLSEAEQARRTQIEADLKVAQQAFAVFLAQMEQDVARISQADRERARAIDERRLGRVRELQATLSQLGHGAVALHYLVTDERVRIIVTLPTTQIGREAAIAAADLNRLIQDFRSVLQNPKADPRPLAQKLYAVLIAPVAQDLAQFNARMLMLSLDDRLRYIPFAALYDGQQYLIERYQMALLTEASRDKLRDRPEAHWRLAGLGLTQGVKVPGIGTLREAQSFSALPEVRRELEAIVKTDAKGSSGVLPGEVQFDAQFTEATLQRLLDAGYPVLHLASHFQFRPGSDDASYLVLGNGQSLSLAELKGERFNFQNIDLLTLSACETAVGGGKDANGQEIEGFGALAQIKGARGVLASLWKVADTSTATLMVLTYRNREEGQLTKAEALQQAQLALLRGAQTASDATAARGATRTPAAAQTAAAPAFATDPKVPFAHPFYWAPFILMGNWL